MVRLPKAVADAKAEFERNNAIKDAVNNPRKILKDTPFETLFEYANPTVAVLCQRKLMEYNLLALVVRTKIMGCGPIANRVAQKVAELMALYAKGLAQFPLVNENFAPETFGDWSRYNSMIPECLQETSKLTDMMQDIGKDLFNLFKGDSSTSALIDEVVKSIKAKIKKVGDALKSGFNSVMAQVKFVVKTFNDAFKLVQSKIQLVLFALFDLISDYLRTTGLGRDIAKLRQYHSCLTTNCRPNNKYMVDMEDVMPNMMVNLPIDQFTGEFRVYRLFIYAESYPDLNTSEGSRLLSEMDSDYAAYCEMRKDKLKQLAQSVNDKLDIGSYL